ncbi:MAG: sulfite exporter TauE/SafE family protein [Clostridia bacterium]|nr:sulfite exporter TauE/SafE family protein [Clostridia bacterium]
MQLFITFLEGILSFLSPCMLPMLPVYLSYFAGSADADDERDGGRTVSTFGNALAFVLGFTAVFTALGVFAGTVGVFLARYQTAVRVISGIVVILFGVSYLGAFELPFFKGMKRAPQVRGILSAFLFGVIYSVSLTPCVGAFLGSAILMASTAGSAGRGALLLLAYSLGLGIPFVLAALTVGRLRTLSGAIKQHYRALNIVCGCFLILVGAAMAAGWMNRLMAALPGI